ncbi:MAG TPA: hypothetical protein VFB63_27955 [Bryobacteraceae bacterium]|jgi:hypothetical protein|nr:hypothetical protein [Bryobacteraceae bacterium]
MIWKSIWRIGSTSILTDVFILGIAAILGSLSIYFPSPLAALIAGAVLFLLIYRLRYGRF